MKLSKKRQRELEDKMVGIFVNMIVEVYAQKEWRQDEGRAEFLKRVYEANLAKNSKELFLLGAEAACVFRQMPEAFNRATERLKRKRQ
jgi:DNA-binding ferritin-like protein (Dps family)